MLFTIIRKSIIAIQHKIYFIKHYNAASGNYFHFDTGHGHSFIHSRPPQTIATPSPQPGRKKSQVLTFPHSSFQWIFFEMNAVHVCVRVPAGVYSPDDSFCQTRRPALSPTHFHQQPQSCEYEPGSTAQCHPPHSLPVREEK